MVRKLSIKDTCSLSKVKLHKNNLSTSIFTYNFRELTDLADRLSKQGVHVEMVDH